MNEEKKGKLIARFMSMVSETPTARGCRAWLGYVRPDGYGSFELCENGKASSDSAHRVAYAIGADAFGILRMYGGGGKRGLVVRHAGPGDGGPCDFKHCVEFSHLALGTQRENIDDNIVQGKILRGERVGTAKLTEPEVRAIVAEYTAARKANGGRTPRGFAIALASRYGVGRNTPRDLAVGNTWRHLEMRT